MQIITDTPARFRWVICQLDALRKCRSTAALEKALTRLPKNLYETYDRVLANIDSDDRKDALYMLRWLAFSMSTVSLAEAVDVLATDPDAENRPLFDRRHRLRDPRDILVICPSLVTITVSEATVQYAEDSNDKGIDRNDARFTLPGEIRLAHFSVREYLTSEHLRTSDTRLSYYHLNQEIAEVFIAKTCLAYLLQFDQNDSLNGDKLASYPLCSYAARHWSLYAGSDPACRSVSLQRLITNLLEPTHAAYAIFLWLYRLDHSWEPPFISPLYLTSWVGLAGVSQSLLKNGSNVNAQEGCYGNALQVASVEGHAAVIQVLLEHGADINAQGGVYGTALQAASSEGHPAVVRLLLEKGADANAKGGEYGNALRAAVFRGNDTIVQLLLEKGADVNAQGRKYPSVLQAASQSRTLEARSRIIQLLLERGADPKDQ
jgi:Ankyrin repeats (3 copies)/Ankyrin repeat